MNTCTICNGESIQDLCSSCSAALSIIANSDRFRVSTRSAIERLIELFQNDWRHAPQSRILPKILYIDTETTGLDPSLDEIIQIAAIIEENGKTLFQKSYLMRPSDSALARLTPEIAAIHGYTPEEIRTFADQVRVQAQFVADISTHINKYDHYDKAYFGGFNAPFDLAFVAEWFKRCNDPYLGSFINWRQIDARSIVYLLEYLNLFPKVINHKLKTLCDALYIPIQAHDALSDIQATRDLTNILLRCMRIYFTPPVMKELPATSFGEVCEGCRNYPDICLKCEAQTKETNAFAPVLYKGRS